MRQDTKNAKGKPAKKGNFRKDKKRDDPKMDKFSKFSTADSRVCAGSKDNDPKWYSLNEQLLRDTASYPYAWPLGNKLNLGQYGANFGKGSIPGIMVMNWIPTVGYASDATSAINVASINTYTKVRHDNSGHANYDHADYMMYLMAMDSVYAFHSWMRRAYGVALTYSNTNRYYPRAAIHGMGIDFNDIQRNLADFRQYINMFAVKASALAIPANMSIMSKHYWMSEGMYYDSKQDKPQTYMFNPMGFYKFALSSGEAPHGTLSFVPLFGASSMGWPYSGPQPKSNKRLTLSDIIAYGDDLLAPIISDEDFGIMSGDTLKSFGIGGCYTLPNTEETYTVLPSYSEEVLDQIQNATFVGNPEISSLLIDQDVSIGAGWIKTDPLFTHPWVSAPAGSELPGQNAYLINRFLTFEHGDIAPANTMEASRWTNICDEVKSAADLKYRVPTMGSEVMCTGNILYFAENTAGVYDIRVSENLFVSMNVDLYDENDGVDFKSESAIQNYFNVASKSFVKQIQDVMLLVQQLSVFDRHPAIYITSFMGLTLSGSINSGSGASTTFSVKTDEYGTLNGVMFDVNYYTILSSIDLEAMSHIALLSEFDVTTR